VDDRKKGIYQRRSSNKAQKETEDVVRHRGSTAAIYVIVVIVCLLAESEIL
jgi:hypothetical protein